MVEVGGRKMAEDRTVTLAQAKTAANKAAKRLA
jgi:hypothetical protein